MIAIAGDGPDPGRIRDDVLIYFVIGDYLRPVAGIRNPEVDDDTISGAPIYKGEHIQAMFETSHEYDVPVFLHLCRHGADEHGADEQRGMYRVLSCDPFLTLETVKR